jgi:hypothetical protein
MAAASALALALTLAGVQDRPGPSCPHRQNGRFCTALELGTSGAEGAQPMSGAQGLPAGTPLVSPQTVDPQASGPQDPNLAMAGAQVGWDSPLVRPQPLKSLL